MQVVETVVFQEEWPAGEPAADASLQPFESCIALAWSARRRNQAQGRKILNTVPLWPALVLLRTRSTPWCFCTVFLTSESPMPLPAAPFVVKKGSQMRARFFAVMPLPVSAKVRRNPRPVFAFPFMRRERFWRKFSRRSASHRPHSAKDWHTFAAIDEGRRKDGRPAVTRIDRNILRVKARLVKIQHGTQQFRNVRLFRIASVAQLHGRMQDLRNSLYFFAGQSQILAAFFSESSFSFDEVV